MPSVNQTMINLVENASVWSVPAFVHEIRTPDSYLSARSKVDLSEAIFIFSFMQAAVFVNRRVVNYFPTNFHVCVTIFTSFPGQALYARSSSSRNKSLASSSLSFVGA
jgi:hypothetical protein